MAQKIQWVKTKYPGIRYRSHPTRKHGVSFDRYFTITYKLHGKTKTEALGWASEGMTLDKAAHIFGEIKANQRSGDGPCSLQEKRLFADEKKRLAELEAKQREKENVTFGDFFIHHYFPIAQTSKKNISYKKELGHFRNWIQPVIGDVLLKNVAPIQLERIKKNMLDAGKSARTIEYVFATLRQVWNMAKRQGDVSTESPTKLISRPRVKNKRMRFLSMEETEALLENLMNRSRQLHDMALLSLDTGLRAGEIFSLTWSCINLSEESIFVMDSKGDDRTVYMTGRVNEMFQRQLPGSPSELIFKNRNGEKIASVSNAFDRAIQELGFNDGISDRRQRVVFHTLRHTHASRLVMNGTDLYTVKTLMGHSTLAITERYAHLAPDTLKAAVKNIDNQAATVIPMPKKANNKSI